MTTPSAVAGGGGGGGTVSHMPQLVIEEGKFEGEEVQQTVLTIAATGRLLPMAMPNADATRVVTIGDILTIQVDVKVTGVSFDIDTKGNLTRVQRAKPIEGNATIVDVVRHKDTRVR